MKPQDFDAFCEMLDLIAEQHSKTLSDGLKMLYWQGLKDFDIEAITQAAYRHLRNPDTGQFMPKIADFIRMLQGSTQDSALRAWAKVNRAIREKGPYCSVVFDDALIHRVIQDMGGWIALGGKEDKEWPFIAKEFENRYRGFKVMSQTPEYKQVLIGIYDAENQKNGFRDYAHIEMIGDHQAATIVMNGVSDKPAPQLRRVG
jgi:hypothetical protein